MQALPEEKIDGYLFVLLLSRDSWIAPNKLSWGCVEDLDKVIQAISANFQPEFSKPFSLVADRKTSSLDARTPEKQGSAHTGWFCKKNTQRRNGVRMRHRWAVAQRNRNGWGMGDTPSWRQNTNAHCYSRALLVALFFSESACGASACTSIPPLSLKLLFYNQPLIALRLFSCLLPRQSKGEKPAQTHDKTESAIENAAQHRFGVRMRYRRKNQRIQDVASSIIGLATASKYCRCQLLFTRTIYCFILYSLFHHDASNLLFECFP